MAPKQKLALFTAALAILASALAAIAIVGREVRLVEIIAIFAGGFGAGASLTAAVLAMRSARTASAGEGVASSAETSGDA